MNKPKTIKRDNIEPTANDDVRLSWFAVDGLGASSSLTTDRRVRLPTFCSKKNSWSTWWWSMVWRMFRRRISSKELEAPPWTAAEEVGKDSDSKIKKAMRYIEIRVLREAMNLSSCCGLVKRDWRMEIEKCVMSLALFIVWKQVS